METNATGDSARGTARGTGKKNQRIGQFGKGVRERTLTIGMAEALACLISNSSRTRQYIGRDGGRVC